VPKTGLTIADTMFTEVGFALELTQKAQLEKKYHENDRTVLRAIFDE
jgi:hypothetical protein